MFMFGSYLVVFGAGFAAGWAFFKHRATIKIAVKDEVGKVEEKL
jgi:hypothetical protein